MHLLDFLLQVRLPVSDRLTQCVIVGLCDLAEHPVEIAAVDHRLAIRTNSGFALYFRKSCTALRTVGVFVNITRRETGFLNESPVFNKRFISTRRQTRNFFADKFVGHTGMQGHIQHIVLAVAAIIGNGDRMQIYI
ncbi:hypothetical protein SDC9_43968 [bioreactor metagenome]|uniref:Uncharacterized protein n=1 Tax=bioreactor metagenome TaxID=1076179 RepID=A0A644W5T1_9ZZZZ